MKRIMKKNQVIITVLAVMIAIAGYLTYAGRVEPIQNQQDEAKEALAEYDTYVAGKSDESSAAQNTEPAVVKENEGQEAADEEAAEGSKAADSAAWGADEDRSDQADSDMAALEDIQSLDNDIDDPGEAVLANGLTVTDYLAQTRLAREQTRGKNKEDLLAVIDSDTQNEVDKQAAIDAMVKLTDCSDKENAVETLLSAKGFENSIVSITDDSVDVIICQNNLTDAELAQIEDIVKRKTSVTAAQICVTLMGSNE